MKVLLFIIEMYKVLFKSFLNAVLDFKKYLDN